MFIGEISQTPIDLLENNTNKIFIKREDLIPFSFGGNKARKAFLFFKEIDLKKSDVVITYGSSSSNHCRVVANMAKQRNIECVIISPDEFREKETYNSKMMEMLGAKLIYVPVNEVHNKIESIVKDYKEKNRNPYFIPGGGHGNIGTQAYVDCFKEIINFENETGVKFDYIFHASGTGTTQAGLVCGELMSNSNIKIVGISIARRLPRGKNIVLDSEREYLNEKNIRFDDNELESRTIFIDDYVDNGYGKSNDIISNTIKNMFCKYGIPLDETYTGKAYTGMLDYIAKEKISNKNILFIHTGGTPLYFDFLKGL